MEQEGWTNKQPKRDRMFTLKESYYKSAHLAALENGNEERAKRYLELLNELYGTRA